jgi:hypothetical protein
MRPFRLLPVAFALLAACSRPAPQPTVSTERVENDSLGIAVATLPAPFAVAVNQRDRLRLEAPGPAQLEIAIGEERTTGINLIDEIEARKAWFERAPDGVYLGNRELMTPIGTAFTARGTYTGAGGPVEECWVYAIHPGANRVLTLTYTYPTGQSEQRVQELISVLGEIEGSTFHPTQG